MIVSDLIGLALRTSGVLGVGQTAASSDTADAFTQLNMMLAQWSRRRFLTFQVEDVSCVSTGATSYTIGLNNSADFYSNRVDRVLSGYARMLAFGGAQRADYPLTVIGSREDYAGIVLKGMAGFPCAVYLDPGFPVGTLYFYPVPQANIYSLHILAKTDLVQFATTSDTINLPPEYQEALLYNLAVRMRPLYGLPGDAIITTMAKTSLATIRVANTTIPLLRMPRGVMADPGMGFGPSSYGPAGGPAVFDTNGDVVLDSGG